MGDNSDKVVFDGESMANTFAAISDQISISSQQLLLFMDIIDGKSTLVIFRLTSLCFK